MPFIYITGPAGSGKSTLQRELLKHGFKAYDEDDRRVGAPHNKSSNEATSLPPINERSASWFNEHEWRVLDKALQRLKRMSKSGNVFLLGNSISGAKISQTFDKVFYLDIDDKTLRKRITARLDNDYGKNPDELKRIVEMKQKDFDQIRNIEHTTIDASQQIESVISEILKHLQ